MVSWRTSKEEGAESAEILGVDWRTGERRLESKKKARRKKCNVRFSLIKKNKAFQRSYMKVEVKKLLRAGMVPARTWRVHAAGLVPTERLKLRRQMAAAGGRKEYVILVPFHGGFWSGGGGRSLYQKNKKLSEAVWFGKLCG